MEKSPLSAFAGLMFLAAVAPAFAQTSESLENTNQKWTVSADAIGGAQIAWASDAFAYNVMADGVTTFGGSAKVIQFELGTFVEGFDPTQASPTEWAANWIVLQTATYDPNDDQVIQTGTLVANTSPFYEGAQAYIWGYTTKDVSEGAEWIVLGADSWTWPAHDANLPSTFSVSDVTQSHEMLFGSVNSSTNGVLHHMQLELVTVPEPAGISLLGFAAAGWGWRRRR
jgi:hypothetical protein